MATTSVDDLVIRTNERVRWTEELHEIFVKAALKLGPKAVPSRILAEMNCTALTRDQVASHLQNYRTILFPPAPQIQKKPQKKVVPASSTTKRKASSPPAVENKPAAKKRATSASETIDVNLDATPIPAEPTPTTNDNKEFETTVQLPELVIETFLEVNDSCQESCCAADGILVDQSAAEPEHASAAPSAAPSAIEPASEQVDTAVISSPPNATPFWLDPALNLGGPDEFLTCWDALFDLSPTAGRLDLAEESKEECRHHNSPSLTDLLSLPDDAKPCWVCTNTLGLVDC